MYHFQEAFKEEFNSFSLKGTVDGSGNNNNHSEDNNNNNDGSGVGDGDNDDDGDGDGKNSETLTKVELHEIPIATKVDFYNDDNNKL